MILLLATSLSAFEITIKRGLEGGNAYSLLHIVAKEPFRCITFYDDFRKPSKYKCKLIRNYEMAPNKSVKNEFFSITFEKLSNGVEVKIVPKKESKIFALPKPAYQGGVVQATSPTASEHWMVLGYEATPPYIESKIDYEDRIDFPIELKEYSILSIGALDISGEPVFMKKHKDVELFISVKSAYEAQKYKRTYELSLEAMESYPDSIFASDFLRYMIKSLAKQDMKGNSEKIIEFGKKFIKQYTTDEYLPEMLLILARVYSALGFESDAKYFFDRLINEHKRNRFADLGLIYLGDLLYFNGKKEEATKRYLEAYYETEDLEVASLAAYKLALRYFDSSKPKKAKEYIEKIWEKNPDFLLKEPNDAYDIARRLAVNKFYDLAIKIDKEILKRAKKLDDIYEKSLFDIAQWYDKKGDVKSAIRWYKRYLDEFAFGEYSDLAKESLDALFIVSKESNSTIALDKLNSLIKDYSGEEIAQKALVAKAKLLFELKRYKEVIELKDDIEDIDNENIRALGLEEVNKAAKALFEAALKEKNCKQSISLKDNYSFKIEKRMEEFFYNCYIKFARYDEALKVAKGNLGSLDLRDRARWLCKTLHTLVLLQRYDEAKDAASDFKKLAENNNDLCENFIWDLARALHFSGPYEEEIALIKKASKLYPDDIRVAELYRAGYESAKKSADKIQQLWMLEKLLMLQDKKRVKIYSPWVEFELIRQLKEQNRLKRALSIAKGMRELNLKGKDRSRWLYLLGSLYGSLDKNQEAKAVFKECSLLKDADAWRALCIDALTLLEDK